MRFYLVDRITELDPGVSIRGVKCWTLSDEIFADHFPGLPMVPGVLLIESCAQLLGVLIDESYGARHPGGSGVYVVLSIVHKAKFRVPVHPGDRCDLAGTLRTLDRNRATGSAQVLVDSELVAEVDLSFTMIEKERLPENPYLQRRDAEYRDILLGRRERARL
jgi:3-hydroxyacyl-[acyl-carrier-protein] dehydratase